MLLKVAPFARQLFVFLFEFFCLLDANNKCLAQRCEDGKQVLVLLGGSFSFVLCALVLLLDLVVAFTTFYGHL